MPPVDRKNPVRAKSSDSRYSVMEFMREFPDDEACLRWLWQTRCAVDEDGKQAFCPECELDRPFHRVSGRPAWDCDYCGYHLHPTAGHDLPQVLYVLQLWFYAMFLISQTRCGISAKQLEREMGVTYKTAWRMLNKIRNQLMDESRRAAEGEVEVDETAIGGKPRKPATARRASREAVGRAKEKKTPFSRWSSAGPCPGDVSEGREQKPEGRDSEHVLSGPRSTPTSGSHTRARQHYGPSPHPPRRESLRDGEVHTKPSRASSAT